MAETSGKLREPLGAHLERVRAQHRTDLQAGAGSVERPYVLRVKYPRAPWEWPWQWVLPVTWLYVDRETGERRRHHLHESVVQRAVKDAAPRASPSPRAAPGCATPSRRFCSRAATTSGRSRSCSATAT